VKILPLLAFCFLAGCAAKRENAFVIGVSTEAQAVADRGQPESRSVASDGTITDVYLDDVHLMQMADGKLVALSDDKKAEFVMRNYYVFSATGVLQNILIDIPHVGANGEIVHNIQDTANMTINITGRHKSLSEIIYCFYRAFAP
jgi:hypothetical protein